jgi:UDP-N-acetylglucosamine/UDP-N-acetylgalactosamine diphosphorylase
VQRFMMTQHRRWLAAAGTRVRESVPVEISPLWALDAEGVAARGDRPGTIEKSTYLRDR